MTVTLPAGVTVVKTAVTPSVKPSGSGAYPAPVVSGNTVIFADAPLSGRKRRTFTVWVRVASEAALPLVFASKLTNCDLAANNVSEVAGRAGIGNMKRVGRGGRRKG